MLVQAALALVLLQPTLELPKDGVVQRPDVRIHFRTVGKGKPLVILAGGPGQDVRQLSGVYDQIKSIRQCVLFDQRGTGKSRLDKIDETTIALDHYIDDLEAFRQQMKLPKISLLGHSWGAMLALAYAVRYPAAVDELTLISSGPVSLDPLGPAADNVTQRRALLYFQGKLQESQTLFELRPFFFDQKKAEAFAARNREGEVAVSVSQFIFPELQKKSFDLRPGARKLSCRALIIQGRQDVMPESFVVELQQFIPGAQLAFVERSGHFPWVEQPEAFFKILNPFLKSDRS